MINIDHKTKSFIS